MHGEQHILGTSVQRRAASQFHPCAHACMCLELEAQGSNFVPDGSVARGTSSPKRVALRGDCLWGGPRRRFECTGSVEQPHEVSTVTVPNAPRKAVSCVLVYRRCSYTNPLLPPLEAYPPHRAAVSSQWAPESKRTGAPCHPCLYLCSYQQASSILTVKNLRTCAPPRRLLHGTARMQSVGFEM